MNDVSEAGVLSGLSGLDWSDDSPASAGYYWCLQPGSHEPPAVVRVAAVGEALTVYFGGLPVHVPKRMLAGARWARAIARPDRAAVTLFRSGS